jgi:hypothetical protein
MTSRNELRHAVWRAWRIRPPADLTAEQLEDLLMLRQTTVKATPVNNHRDAVMAHIAKNKGRLSLPCDGNCYNHHDGVVLSCYAQLVEAHDQASKTEDTQT